MDNRLLIKRLRKNIRSIRLLLFFHVKEIYGSSVLLRQIIKDYFLLNNLDFSKFVEDGFQIDHFSKNDSLELQRFIKAFEEGDFDNIDKSQILSLVNIFEALIKEYSKGRFIYLKRILCVLLLLLSLTGLFFLFYSENTPWRVVYYDNAGLVSPPVNTFYAKDVSLDNISQNIAAPFSARFVACLKISRDYEIVKFSLRSDDGSRLFIDHKVVVDNWGRHESKKVSSKIPISAGTYLFEIQYNNEIGNSDLGFSIEPEELLSKFVKSEYGLRCP